MPFKDQEFFFCRSLWCEWFLNLSTRVTSAYGKLIKFFSFLFQVPCWQRKSLYLLHSSFWSRLSLPTLCVCVLVRRASAFPLGEKKNEQKTSGEVNSTCCAVYCMFSHCVFPTSCFSCKPNQWRPDHSELFFSSESTFFVWMCSIFSAYPPPLLLIITM